MPAAMTFTSLKQDVQRYLERGGASTDPDVYEQIPALINLAERRISRELKVQGFIRTVTTTFTTGLGVYAKPDRFREVVSINIGTGATNASRKTLKARSYEYCRTYAPDESVTGEPEFYADYGPTYWLIVPSPDEDYPGEISYYELLALLDDVNQTNWLTENAPQLLLYATLLEASPFLKNDTRIPVWKNFYDDALSSLKTEDLERIDDRSSTRKGA